MARIGLPAHHGVKRAGNELLILIQNKLNPLISHLQEIDASVYATTGGSIPDFPLVLIH